jgi:hypothetical protein
VVALEEGWFTLAERSWMERIKHYVESSVMVLPDESVRGEPFWMLMEIKDGNNTGNYHAIGIREGKKMLMLFLQLDMARGALGQLQAYSGDFEVRGVSTGHLHCLLRLVEDGYPLELVVAAAGLDQYGQLQGAPMSSGQIRQMLDHN